MSDQRPNILLFFSEQHRGDCLGCEGHPVLLTPNLDHLAGSGARFTRAYSTCPTCIAARRSLLSGQFPATHGMVGYREEVPWEIEDTLPAVLSRAGYQTCWVGRSMHQHPVEKPFGFGKVVPMSSKGPCEYRAFLDRHAPETHGGVYGTGSMHNDWTGRPWHLDECLHHTNWIVHQAMRFLEDRDPGRPFLLVVSFHAAHPPLLPPRFYFERYLRTGVPEPVIGDWAEEPEDGGMGLSPGGFRTRLRGEALLCARAGYYGLINHIDDQVNRLINGVSGVDKMTNGNTAIIFSSDHGEMLGDHYCWHKARAYEAAARIPFLVRPPRGNGMPAGQVIDAPVCIEDLMPTILDFAGVEIPGGVEGSSVLSLMRNRGAPWRDCLPIEHSPRHQALTDGREKFIWNAQDGGEQFFDLVADPDECHDLARLPEAGCRVAGWRERLVRHLRGRPEGFSDGKALVPGRPYPPVISR